MAKTPEEQGPSPSTGRESKQAAPPESSARIMEAAIDEFGQHGYAGARVDRIAQLAGVNKQLIYYYFQSKAGLYDAVFRQTITRGYQERETEPEDFSARVQQMNEPDPATTTRVWHRFWLWEALEKGESTPILLADERTKVWDDLTAQVTEAQRDGVIDSRFDPAMLALALHSLTATPHLLPQITRLITGDSHVSPDFAQRQRTFLAELVAHLGPPSD